MAKEILSNLFGIIGFAGLIALAILLYSDNLLGWIILRLTARRAGLRAYSDEYRRVLAQEQEIG